MAFNTTYSFTDNQGTISFPTAGVPVILNGSGVGEIHFDFPSANTTQHVAADGAVAHTKIIAQNGHITVTLQQTQLINHTLQGIYNFQLGAPGLVWSQGVITLTSALTLDNILCTGVAFEKQPERIYQQEISMWQWSFYAQNMVYVN